MIAEEMMGGTATPESLALDRHMCKAWAGAYMLFNIIYSLSSRLAVVNRKEELIVEAKEAGFMLKSIEKGSSEAATPKELRKRARSKHKVRRRTRRAHSRKSWKGKLS